MPMRARTKDIIAFIFCLILVVIICGSFLYFITWGVVSLMKEVKNGDSPYQHSSEIYEE